MKEIRYAREDDISTISKLGVEFAKEYGLDYDEDSIILSVNNLFLNPNKVMLVAEVEGEVVGTLLAVASLSLFNSEQTQLNELMFYVDKKYRGSKAGLELLLAYDDLAKEYSWSFLIAPEAMKTDKLDNLYTKLGYKKFETTYKKVI